MMIELLANHHDKKSFDCGNVDLNRYLQQYANQHAKKGLSKTHVLTATNNPNQILGFYSLTVQSFQNEKYGLPVTGYPCQLEIPCVLIGRLGVDNTAKGKGISTQLIRHALLSVKTIAQLAGVAFVVVEPKTHDLIEFYKRLGFVSSLYDPLFMVLPVKKLL